VKILIDTNIILDVLCNRADFVEHSSNVWKICETAQVEGYICALSVPNIVYILRKELTAEKTEDIIKKLLLIFRIADLTAKDITCAAKMHLSDFEDALQISCASRIKAQYIVTRNVKDFVDSPIAAVKPSEFLDRL
jgi:predicted nucleic acid-binding protein